MRRSQQCCRLRSRAKAGEVSIQLCVISDVSSPIAVARDIEYAHGQRPLPTQYFPVVCESYIAASGRRSLTSHVVMDCVTCVLTPCIAGSCRHHRLSRIAACRHASPGLYLHCRLGPEASCVLVDTSLSSLVENAHLVKQFFPPISGFSILLSRRTKFEQDLGLFPFHDQIREDSERQEFNILTLKHSPYIVGFVGWTLSLTLKVVRSEIVFQPLYER